MVCLWWVEVEIVCCGELVVKFVLLYFYEIWWLGIDYGVYCVFDDLDVLLLDDVFECFYW